MSEIKLMLGDCLDRLKDLDDNSVDSIVTDPPYGLSFMGKAWDKSVPSKDVWEECLRVLKPGGYLLAFAGTRTQHRMAVNIEDAGFEIRDMIAWVYGSGFPKSLNISKAIDATILTGGSHSKNIKQANSLRPGESRDTSTLPNNGIASGDRKGGSTNDNIATDEAKQWNGWGTALKPALEPITVARKPLEGTVAANVLKYGTGGINIDASRVATNPDVDDPRLGDNGSWKTDNAAKNVYEGGYAGDEVTSSALGRFPANLIHDGSEEVTELFPNTKSGRSNGNAPIGESGVNTPLRRGVVIERNDDGSAARFFYCAKTSKKDRNEGLDHLADKEWKNEGAAIPERGNRPFIPSKNNHPTVKPTELMKYLVRMVTPKGGTVLDPFMGSGSTGKAAKLEGFDFIGVELDPDYMLIAETRIDAAEKETTLEGFFE